MKKQLRTDSTHAPASAKISLPSDMDRPFATLGSRRQIPRILCAGIRQGGLKAPCLSRMYSRFYRLIAPFFRRSHRQTMEIAYNGSGARFCLRFGDSRQAPRKAESCGHAMPSPISNIQPGKHRKPPCSDGAAFCQAFSSRRGKAQGTKRQYAASSEPTEVLRLHSA